MPLTAYSPPKGNLVGLSRYKLKMLYDLLLKATKAGMSIGIAEYEGSLWYTVHKEYLCPVDCKYSNYVYACKVLRPQIRAAKHSAIIALLSGIEKADLIRALKALGYKVQ